MDAAHLIAFNLTLLAALASPGPAMLMALRTTLIAGRRAGILLGLGLGTAAAVWTMLSLLGLNVVFTLFPWAYLTLKLTGAAYLIYLAFTIWRDARTPLETKVRAVQHHHILRGMLVNLSNPKSMLFASAVLVVIFPRDLALADKALIVANHMLVEWIAYAGFALALSTRPARDGYLRLKPVFDRVAATMLAVLGLRLLADR
jgi:threonine/homoserine/homoserine lactone efflux protein